MEKYGKLFQSDLIYCLITNQPFLEKVYHVLDDKYIEDISSQWFLDNIKNHFDKYSTPPTLQTLAVLSQDIIDSVVKERIRETLQKFNKKDVSEPNLKFVQDKAIDFLKQQEMQFALKKSIELCNQGKLSEILSIVEQANDIGSVQDFGHYYTKDLEKRLNEEPRNTIETPWSYINELMDGGLGGGELGVVMANTGRGKSWALCAISLHLIKKGYTIYYYTLELNNRYVARRHDTILTNINSKQLKFHADKIREEIKQKVLGEGIITYYPTKTCTLGMIKSHIRRGISLGYKPDAIIIDYADNLQFTTRYKDYRFDIKSLYEHMRGMAGELDVPIWTATQANRSGVNQDVIEDDKVSEAYSKMEVSDFCFSISRKREDVQEGTGRCFIVKNRFGEDKITCPMRIDFGTGLMEILSPRSVSGEDANNKMSGHSEYAKDFVERAKEKKEVSGFE